MTRGFSWTFRVFGVLFGALSLFNVCRRLLNTDLNALMTDVVQFYESLYVPILNYLDNKFDWIIPNWNHDLIALIVFVCSLNAKMRIDEAGGWRGALRFIAGAEEYRLDQGKPSFAGDFCVWLLMFFGFIAFTLLIPYVRLVCATLMLSFAALLLPNPIIPMVKQEATIENRFIVTYYWGSILGLLIFFAINSA